MRGHDDRDDRRGDAADGVDRQALPPARRLRRASQCRIMPGLGDREVDEHADRVQRDERVGLALEDDHERRGDQAQRDDPAREGEPVAAERELAREEAVLGEDGAEPRERVEARCSRPGTAGAR